MCGRLLDWISHGDNHEWIEFGELCLNHQSAKMLSMRKCRSEKSIRKCKEYRLTGKKKWNCRIICQKFVTRFQRWIICYNENANLNATKSGKVNFKSTKQIVAYACDAYMFYWYVQTNKQTTKKKWNALCLFSDIHFFLAMDIYIYSTLWCVRATKNFFNLPFVHKPWLDWFGIVFLYTPWWMYAEIYIHCNCVTIAR